MLDFTIEYLLELTWLEYNGDITKPMENEVGVIRNLKNYKVYLMAKGNFPSESGKFRCNLSPVTIGKTLSVIRIQPDF